MIEASGDRTVITFANMATGTSALQPEEAKAFTAPADRGAAGRGGLDR